MDEWQFGSDFAYGILFLNLGLFQQYIMFTLYIQFGNKTSAKWKCIILALILIMALFCSIFIIAYDVIFQTDQDVSNEKLTY